jgi:hypothetical protein
MFLGIHKILIVLMKGLIKMRGHHGHHGHHRGHRGGFIRPFRPFRPYHYHRRPRYGMGCVTLIVGIIAIVTALIVILL